MSQVPAPLGPEAWLAHLFGSKAAREGAVVRRKLRDIERYVGREKLRRELERRGFHAVENAQQWIIFCNNEPVSRVL